MDATEKADIEAKHNGNDQQSDEDVEQKTEEKDDSRMEEKPTDDKPEDKPEDNPADSGEIYDTTESPKGDESAVGVFHGDAAVEDVPEDDRPTSPPDIPAMTDGKYLEGENCDKDYDNVVTIELPAEKTGRNSPEIMAELRFPERLPSDWGAAQPVGALMPKYYSPLLARKQQYVHLPKTPEKRSACQKFRHCLLLAVFSSLVSGYAIGGAYLFSHLERKREVEYSAKIDKWKNDTAILLATELRQVTPFEGTWARKVFQHLEIFERDLLKASAIGYRRYEHRDREQRWTWTNSLYFSVALMTTSGYGPMTPRSEMGRTATVLYSLFGIPLAVSWLMVVGYTLATIWASLFQNICCSLCHERLKANVQNFYPTANHNHSMKRQKFRKNSVVPVEEQRLIYRSNGQLGQKKNACRTKYPPKSHNNYSVRNNIRVKSSSLNVPDSLDITGRTENDQIQELYHTMDYATAIVYAIVLFIVYFMFFSILFSLLEEWILTDVLYFSYLMFATLGPGCHEMQDDGSEIKIKSNIFYTVYLCTGYCILSMILNLMYMLIQNRPERVKVYKSEPFDTFYQEKF